MRNEQKAIGFEILCNLCRYRGWNGNAGLPACRKSDNMLIPQEKTCYIWRKLENIPKKIRFVDGKREQDILHSRYIERLPPEGTIERVIWELGFDYGVEDPGMENEEKGKNHEACRL